MSIKTDKAFDRPTTFAQLVRLSHRLKRELGWKKVLSIEVKEMENCRVRSYYDFAYEYPVVHRYYIYGLYVDFRGEEWVEDLSFIFGENGACYEDLHASFEDKDGDLLPAFTSNYRPEFDTGELHRGIRRIINRYLW